MENQTFVKGRESLLQTLALLREEEEFQEEFGRFPDTMEARRDKSVRGLCEMIARLKTESQVKKECVNMLEDVSKWWRIIQDDRRRLNEKISELEKDKKVLENRVKSLEEEVKNAGVSDGSVYQTTLRGSSDEEGGGGGSDESNPESVENQRRSSEFACSSEFNVGEGGEGGNFGRHPFYTRFDNPAPPPPAEPSTSSTQKPNFEYPLISENPYEKLDRQYYNPTQFFQRQSSTFRQVKSSAAKGRGGGGKGSRGGGGGGGGGRKKSGNSQTPAKKPKLSASKSSTEDKSTDQVQPHDNSTSVGGEDEERSEVKETETDFQYTPSFSANPSTDFNDSQLPDIH